MPKGSLGTEKGRDGQDYLDDLRNMREYSKYV
jgi:hypothetical protein